MTAGVPGLLHMQRVFWTFIGSALAMTVLVNVFTQILYRQQMATSEKALNPARPKSYIFQAPATTTSVIFTYYSSPEKTWKWRFYLSPAGAMAIIVRCIVFIAIHCLYRFDPKDFLQWEDIGYRSRFIAVRSASAHRHARWKKQLNWIFYWTWI